MNSIDLDIMKLKCMYLIVIAYDKLNIFIIIVDELISFYLKSLLQFILFLFI